MANERPVATEQPREIPVSREQLVVPEQQGIPQPEVRIQPQVGTAERPIPASVSAQLPPLAAVPKGPALVTVEHILSEGIGDLYAALDPVTQRDVKEKGEETAKQVVSLLQQASVQVRKIIELITGWLKLIPGVSRLFIEQEAKLKTDRLLAMRRNMRGEE